MNNIKKTYLILPAVLLALSLLSPFVIVMCMLIIMFMFSSSLSSSSSSSSSSICLSCFSPQPKTPNPTVLNPTGNSMFNMLSV